MKSAKFLALLTLSVVLAACAAPAVEVQTLRIGLSPAAHPVTEAISVCVPNAPDLAISIQAIYPNAVDLDALDVYIQLDEPDELPAFVAQLAWEDVVVVLHASNELDLDLEQIADLFSGRVQDWSELGGEDADISLWVGLASEEARLAFVESVAHGSPVVGWAKLAATPADLLAAVAADPQAAGILPAAWANETVQAIDLGLRLPVLALAVEEPSGAARDLLACLQGEVGQAVLAESYSAINP
ncbi:MAG: substrate-binding domain-containing protein [Anaerolineales bacterium]